MKILHVIDSGGLYGAEKMLLTLVSEQIKHGLEPMILSAGEPGLDEKPVETEARRLNLPVTPWRMKPGLNLKETKKLLSWAESAGYEVFHSHGYKFNILFAFFRLKMGARPHVSTVHGYVKAPFPKKMWFYEILDRLALRMVDQVVVVREDMEREIGIQRNVRTIPNGIFIDACKDNTELPHSVRDFISAHEYVILGAGRLSAEKGFDILIQSFAKVREQCTNGGLIIAGEGPERERLEALGQTFELRDHILMPGYVASLQNLLTHVDLLVVSSHTEGLPLVLLEAMSAGCLVVATSVGGIPVVLDHGRAGILVSPGDPWSLEHGLERALKGEYEEGITEKARERVASVYSASSMADSYTELYREVVSRDLP